MVSDLSGRMCSPFGLHIGVANEVRGWYEECGFLLESKQPAPRSNFLIYDDTASTRVGVTDGSLNVWASTESGSARRRLGTGNLYLGKELLP
jgi:hypothetical protein